MPQAGGPCSCLNTGTGVATGRSSTIRLWSVTGLTARTVAKSSTSIMASGIVHGSEPNTGTTLTHREIERGRAARNGTTLMTEMGTVLDQIREDLHLLAADFKAMTERLDRRHEETQRAITDVRLSYVTKSQYDEDRKTRRTIVLGVATILVSIATATWAIIASRQPPVVVESGFLVLGLLGSTGKDFTWHQ